MKNKNIFYVIGLLISFHAFSSEVVSECPMMKESVLRNNPKLKMFPQQIKTQHDRKRTNAQ
jgi:hypothetical protein